MSSIDRTLLEVAGTVLTCQLAWHYGIACNVAGGTHHASPVGGAGYTILNDLAVATNFLTKERLHGGSVGHIKQVLVVDCDVHQGDGVLLLSPHSSSYFKLLQQILIHSSIAKVQHANIVKCKLNRMDGKRNIIRFFFENKL